MVALELRYYLYLDGQSPFEKWFTGVDSMARAKVAAAIIRLEQATSRTSNRSGRGCSNTGSSRDGEVLVILLTGGTKKRRPWDIAAAIEMWADYRRRKRS